MSKPKQKRCSGRDAGNCGDCGGTVLRDGAGVWHHVEYKLLRNCKRKEVEQLKAKLKTLERGRATQKPPLASFEAWWESNLPLNASSIYDSERVAAACGGKPIRVRVTVEEI